MATRIARKKVKMARPGRKPPAVEDEGAQVARRRRGRSIANEYPGAVETAANAARFATPPELPDMEGLAAPEEELIPPTGDGTEPETRAGRRPPPREGMDLPEGNTNVVPMPGVSRGTARDRDRDDHHVLTAIREARDEADEARRDRMDKNARNVEAFMDQQDFSYKQEGQSTEFLPKVGVAAEQFGAFVKRALVQFGNWFSVNLNPNIMPVLTDNQIREIIKFHFAAIPDGVNKTTNVETIIGDAAKMALLESLMVFKIYGRRYQVPSWRVEPGTPLIDMSTRQEMPNRRGPPTVKPNDKQTWRLCVDMVDVNNYYPDPTGRGLYEVHRVERDLWELEDMVEAGVYDREIYDMLQTDNPMPMEDKRAESARGQNRTGTPSFRKRCYLDEYWGNILDRDGRVIHRNCLATVVNDKHVIRRPEPNPYWHGRSCFVAVPLIRVPHSVWHKALYDSASQLNMALNEMFNLMLDGGISSVWGISQLRTEHLEDTRQVSNGIPQGITLAVKPSLPANAKVYERVADGSVPQDAMAVFEMLEREFTQAALTNEIKLGSLPPRQVLATEIAQADQSQAVTLDSIAADVEREGIGDVILLSWLTILQHLKDMDIDELSGLIGRGPAEMLVAFPQAEIFSTLAPTANFKVFGLSATLSRVRDFQKTMGLMQAIGSNPMLMQAFWTKYSPDKIINQAMKQLNMNPDELLMTPDEREALPQRLAQLIMFSQLTGQMKGQMNEAQGTAGPGEAGQAVQAAQAETVQEANPMTGMRRY